MQRREEETYLVQMLSEAKMMIGQCYSSLFLLFVYSSGSCFSFAFFFSTGMLCFWCSGCWRWFFSVLHPPFCMAFLWLFIEPENAMRSPPNYEATDRCYCRSNGDWGASVFFPGLVRWRWMVFFEMMPFWDGNCYFQFGHWSFETL